MERSPSRGLGTGITFTFFRQGSGLVLAFVLAVVIARKLGPDGQGKYALAILLPTLIATFFNLGVPSANVFYLGRGDVSVARALKTSLGLWLILAVVGGGIGVVVVYLFSSNWFPGVPPNLLWLTLFAFPLVLLQNFFVSVLQGVQDFAKYNLVLLLMPAWTLALTLVAIFWLNAGLAGALAAYLGAQFAVSIIAWFVLQSHAHTTSRTDTQRTERYWARCIGYGWQAQIANNLAFVNYRADTLLINCFISPAATGLYVIAVVLAEKIWLLSQAVNAVVLPRLSELHDDEDRRRRLTPLATKLVFALSTVMALGLCVVATPLIHTVFGDRYAESVGALRWLLAGIVAGTIARGVSIDLAARGRVDLNMYVAIAIVTFNIFANVVLIPRYGINGAAMATTSAYILNMVVKTILYVRITHNKWYSLVVFDTIDVLTLKNKFSSLKKQFARR